MGADALCRGRSNRVVRVQIPLVLLTLLAVVPTPASAVVFPFEWLIEDGVKFTPLVPGLSAWAAPIGTSPLLGVFRGGCVGSFFGFTELLGQLRNVRADTARFSTASNRWAHLMVIHDGDDAYILVACSTFTLAEPSPLPQFCTLSGTAPQADAVSGRVDYTRPPGSISTILEVEAFLVSPGAP
jgi:hypothetical protein